MPDTSFDWTMKPRRSRDAAFRLMDGEAVVVLSSRAEVKVLNEVGARIWQLCDGEKTASEIARTIGEEFDAPQEELEVDVREFLESLAGNRMLEESARPA